MSNGRQKLVNAKSSGRGYKVSETNEGEGIYLTNLVTQTYPFYRLARQRFYLPLGYKLSLKLQNCFLGKIYPNFYVFSSFC